MVSAYILIKVNPGTASNAVQAISSIEGVKSAHAVTGPYDIIALAEATDFNSLGDLVVAKIQKTVGINRTLSCIIVELT
jgi:DNA-binding Lrp family transcriptional regulator